MGQHSKECGGEVEVERDNATGLCYDCKDHCTMVDLTCDCGMTCETVSNCCGGRVWGD